MSSRLKERGGAGGKIMASYPHKPSLSDGTPKDKATVRRSSPIPAAGKENSRSLSRGRASRPVENAPPTTALVPAATVRWSTSSMPLKGKPSGLSDLSKLLPDLRVDRVPRAEAVQRKSVTGLRDLERCKQGKGRSDPNLTFKDEKPGKIGSRVLNGVQSMRSGSRVFNAYPGKIGGKGANFGVGTEKSSGKSVNEKGNKGFMVSDGRTYEISSVVSKPIDQSAKDNAALEICKENGLLAPSLTSIDEKALILDASGLNSNASFEVVKHDTDVLVNQIGKVCLVSQLDGREEIPSDVFLICEKSIDPSHVEVGERVSDRIRVFENVNDQKTDEVAKGSRVINKYPSKLHEKLALLEGKVQKIASEIKQTKEMLDLNNPDESKLILTDIQNKISGIEKSVGHVINASKLENGISETLKDDKQVSTKGLNHEELEARFFPHHRLLRNRPSVGSSGGQDHSSWSNLPKHDGEVEMKDGLLGPIDEDPIALEFLASLNAGAKIQKDGGNIQSEHVAVKEMGMERISSSQRITNKGIVGHQNENIALMANEKLEDFDDQENKPTFVVHEMIDESSVDQLFEIGQKSSTGGWFVSEGEAVLLAHGDGSCTYYDIANLEVKAEYKPPRKVSNNSWGDCWLIRAPGADGCSGRYVVAASAGNLVDSGFCSWDFYTREIKAFRVEAEAPNYFSTSSSRAVLAPISNSGLHRRSTACTIPAMESPQWWYRPCGPLLFSTASWQKTVNAYDIRDGDPVMKWEVSSPVMGMEYSSPLQWRSRGKVIIAETEAISLWDVNSLNPQPLLAVPTVGKKIYSLHVNNTDAEVGGGVRQRVSSSEVEGNDGVFCTQDSINVFDFRLPSGVGLKISRLGANGHSIFSRGDSIFVGCTEGRLSVKGGPCSHVQHFSLRKGKLAATYALPGFNSHIHHSSLTQVWGNSNLVMGVCGMGLFVFDALKDEGSHSTSHGVAVEVKETIGPDDLYCPTFDYLGSRVLVISRDRPALWKYLS